MQPGGRMLLNDEGESLCRGRRGCLAARFGRLAEVTHLAIALKLFVDQAGGRCRTRLCSFLCLTSHSCNLLKQQRYPPLETSAAPYVAYHFTASPGSCPRGPPVLFP